MAICAMLLLVMTHVSVGILPLQQTVRSKYMTIEQFHDRSVSRASVGATLPLYPCSLHALRGGGPASTTMEPPDSHFRPMHTSAHAHISSDVIASEKEGLAPPTASAPVSTGSPVQEAPVKAPAATLQDFLAALGGAGNTAAKEALKPSCREDSASFGIGMSRSMLAMRVFNEVKSDYETALANISDAKLRTQALKAVHARSAPKALELARQNGGLYNKAAQLVASLQAGAGERGIPHEYVEALSVLTDKAPGKPFAEMTPVLEEEFGKPAADIFKWIDEVPLAAASLAQVHRAELHDGRRVAVKIIYPMLRKEMASDFAVLRTFAASLKPAGLDLSWLLADFEKALSKELDFEEEARNTERSARTLAHLERVKVPGVIWAYTRKSVLTMELEEGLIHLHDAQQLRAAGLNPNTVGALIADTFAEMAVVHGWVHGDPHAGNIYVRAVASASTADAGEESADPQKTAEVVMLDHGQMHELSEEARVRLCHLLLACVERRPAELQQVCREIAGAELQRFLPLLLSPAFALNGYFDGWLSLADLRAAARHQIPASVSLEQLGKCIAGMHAQGGNFLGVLHSMGYTRGLLANIGFSERLRLQSLARYAVLGLMPAGERAGPLSPATLRRLQLAALQVDVSRAMMVALLWLYGSGRVALSCLLVFLYDCGL